VGVGGGRVQSLILRWRTKSGAGPVCVGCRSCDCRPALCRDRINIFSFVRFKRSRISFTEQGESLSREWYPVPGTGYPARVPVPASLGQKDPPQNSKRSSLILNKI
jgi:hypothetical protein